MVNEELKTEVVANWMARFTKNGPDEVTGTEADHVEFLLEAIEKITLTERKRCLHIINTEKCAPGLIPLGAQERGWNDALDEVKHAIEKGEAV